MATTSANEDVVSDDKSSDSVQGDLSPEEKETVCRLYQQGPELWGDFRTVIDFIDTVDQTVLAPYALLLVSFLKVSAAHERVYPDDEKVKSFSLFCSVVGFVDVAVGVYRRALRELGVSYLTDVSVAEKGKEDVCAFLQTLRAAFLGFCVKSEDFSLRLARAGYLDMLLEDLKHIQHMHADALEKHGVYFNSAGTIFNCCIHPASLVLVKQMDMLQHVKPFAAKKGGKQMVPAIAFMILSFIATDEEVDSLRIDPRTLQYLLDKVERAVTTHRPDDKGWSADEILVVFAGLSRCPFNKRVFMAQGMVRVVKLVLKTEERTDKEKRTSVDIIHQLAEDSYNLQILQGDRDLLQTLTSLVTTSSQEMKDAVSSLLRRIQQTRSSSEEPEDLSAFPNLTELLSEEINMLTILEMGEVEYVMDRLAHCTAEGGRSKGTRVKVLQALTELAYKDDCCRREIMSRGALHQLTEILKSGGKDERTQAARVLLELTFCEENREIMKNEPYFTSSLSELTLVTDNEDLSQTAGIIIQSLNQ